MARQPSFTVSGEDATLIRAIVDRARELEFVGEPKYPILSALMDLTACHANGCPIDLAGLVGAHPTDLAHDILGIHTHLDQDTGRLQNSFRPRYAAPGAARIVARAKA